MSGFRSSSMRELLGISYTNVSDCVSTTYIGQVMAQQNNDEPDPEVVARTGYFALLLFSIGKSISQCQRLVAAII